MAKIDNGNLKKIVIISDGTGKTARRLMDAVLSQYSEQQVRFSVEETYKEIRSKAKFKQILKNINSEYLVILSIISIDLISHIHIELEKRNILHLNVLEPMLNTMSKFLGVHPNYEPGLLQIIDDKYYNKVDSIGFTVEHDDGMGHFLEEADIVLIGLSRTCKTPISVYLACNMGLRVANIPIIADFNFKTQLLKRLEKINNEKIVGLMMRPEILAFVREERAKVLGGNDLSKSGLDGYLNLRQIRLEVRFCNDMFYEMGINAIDVSRRAIEEISQEIARRFHHGYIG
ncbi:MAG: kinase/pyrophosphorylase [candidate division Zixibacteria bacterium]|nr:kinase/pyrophosphorylase [candidate division Zixibacteria bacterium]